MARLTPRRRRREWRIVSMLKSLPAADLEHQPSIANDALQKSVHPIAVYCHKQKALVHINQPAYFIPPISTPKKTQPCSQPRVGRPKRPGASTLSQRYPWGDSHWRTTRRGTPVSSWVSTGARRSGAQRRLRLLELSRGSRLL